MTWHATLTAIQPDAYSISLTVRFSDTDDEKDESSRAFSKSYPLRPDMADKQQIIDLVQADLNALAVVDKVAESLQGLVGQEIGRADVTAGEVKP